LGWPSSARVRFHRDFFGFSGSLAHHVIPFSSLHDLLDIWDLVSFDDGERGRVGADCGPLPARVLTVSDLGRAGSEGAEPRRGCLASGSAWAARPTRRLG
jgi:hypothetical protein